MLLGQSWAAFGHSSLLQPWLPCRAAEADLPTPCWRRCRDALEQRQLHRLPALMDRNFDLRRAMFSDEVLGARNLRMVELARSVGGAQHSATLCSASAIRVLSGCAWSGSRLEHTPVCWAAQLVEYSSCDALGGPGPVAWAAAL